MQQLNPSEISDLIKQRIDQLEVTSQATNEGTIVSVTDGIIRIHGLTEVQYGEMIEFDGGVYGLALNLERDSVGALVTLLELEHPADIGAAPAVDALVVVTHRHHACAARSEALEQAMLQPVRVLKFVDHDLSKPRRVSPLNERHKALD